MLARRPETYTALGVVAGLAALLTGGAGWIPWGLSATPVSPDSLFTPDQIMRAEAYSSAVRVPGLLTLGLGVAVLLVVGLSGRVRRLLRRWGSRQPWWMVAIAAVVAIRTLVLIVTLPTAWWAHAIREQYGLTAQGPGSWLMDQLTSATVLIVVDAGIAVVVLACLRYAGRWWAPVAGTLLASLVIIGSFAYPVVVEPLYNSFQRMPDGALRNQLMATAQAEGVQLSDVLIADASRRTTALNAYVSGFGSSKRLVVYDTLLASLSPGEVNVVVAHEVAHEANHDVLHGTLLGAFGVFAGVNLAGLVLSGWFGSVTRRRRAYVWVPWGLAAVAALSLLVAPIQNAASRQVELRADDDALTTSGDSADFIALQRALAVRALADPSPPPLLYWWFATHPTAGVRAGLVGASE